ncbi:MAG: 2-oxoacid:acceptor oxidoreductase family protein [Coriobacteriales bacterium]|nr:2-oxoacid:acceptor oxidoreductase family protein [Coriobacteriales bacterium]
MKNNDISKLKQNANKGIDNIIICGLGGQGNILASKIIASMYMNTGYHVKSTETIGVAQRGGSVISHIRASKIQNIASPIVSDSCSDVIFALDYSQILVNNKLLNNKTKILFVQDTTPLNVTKNFIPFNALDYCEKLNNYKISNILLIAFAIKNEILHFKKEDLLIAIENCVAQKFLDLNKQAVELVFKD